MNSRRMWMVSEEEVLSSICYLDPDLPDGSSIDTIRTRTDPIATPCPLQPPEVVAAITISVFLLAWASDKNSSACSR